MRSDHYANEEAKTNDQYISFNSCTVRLSLYEDYERRGFKLAYPCFYKYTPQTFIQTFKAQVDELFVSFKPTHPLHSTYI
jgi:hypothetical protein